MTGGQANLQVHDERTLPERKVEERFAFRFTSARAMRDVTRYPSADSAQIRLEMVAATSLTAAEAARRLPHTGNALEEQLDWQLDLD